MGRNSDRDPVRGDHRAWRFPASQHLRTDIPAFDRAAFPKHASGWVWHLYVFAAVVPAICEEIAFRGILLHGLRKRYTPVRLTIAAGMIFGLFHFTLFRIGPTAFLGMVITAITLMTGSIFPGMLLHLGNNALGVWGGANAFSLDALQWWQYLGPIVIFKLAIFIIYRNRTPYPDFGRPNYRPRLMRPA
jgi:membrane protease YdiL (CAAX protease family)